MIIGSERPLVVGTRNTNLTDNEARPHYGQPFSVLRVATFEEWLAEAQADGVAPRLIAKTIDWVRRHRQSSYFYEVSID